MHMHRDNAEEGVVPDSSRSPAVCYLMHDKLRESVEFALLINVPG
jgi:hypothetical protein